MSQYGSPQGSSCCGASIVGFRLLTFSDGRQVGITGLDVVMENLYEEGRLADAKTASDIMEQLKSRNYFEPSSRQMYEELFSREYRRFLETKSKSVKEKKNAVANKENRQDIGRRGIISLFKMDKRANPGGKRERQQVK